ncbi:MAG: rod shape-determining protein MreD [bacterium]
MRVVLSLVAVFFGVYLQISIHKSISWTPDFLLIMVIYTGFSQGEIKGSWAGFLFGVLVDVFSGGLIGINAASKTIVGWLCGRIYYRYEHSFLFLMPVFFLITLLDNLLIWLICWLISYPVTSLGFLKVLGISLVNGLAGSILVMVFGTAPRRGHGEFKRLI